MAAAALQADAVRQTLNIETSLNLSGLLALCTIVAVVITQVHRQVWRHTDVKDLMRVGQAAILANLLFLPVVFFMSTAEVFPREILLIELPLLMIFMIFGRLMSRGRATGQLLAAFRPFPKNKPPAIIVGDHVNVASILREVAKSKDGLPVWPLGIVETSGENEGRAISGIQVIGNLTSLSTQIDVFKARYGRTPWIALADPSRSKEVMDHVLRVAAEHRADIQRLIPKGGNGYEPVSPTELLARPERKADPVLVSNLIAGSRVFVTGAGGTIGGELVRQCAAYGPASITLYDASEYNLYEIDMHMQRHFPSVSRQTMLGDVRDKARLHEAMSMAKPDVVIHAAALKHVPLMETNPNEAILTNIEGARQTAIAAARNRAKAFVFISTDKAVLPANVMGATKRSAELFIQAFAPTQPQTQFSIVRFGNVLGSAGSVAPLFEKQIHEGGPVTVTHPDMTRYFMSVEEASSLVLQAASLSTEDEHKDAQLYVLDMDEPVSILSLAKRMIRLKGLQPGDDIEIVYNGLRPGEKLSEQVFYPKESVNETRINGVMTAKTSPPDLGALTASLEALLDAARLRDRITALERLNGIVPYRGRGHEQSDEDLEVAVSD